MSKSTSSYPSLSVDATGTGIVSQAGAVVLLRTARAAGLDTALSQMLSPWRKPLAQFDPGKIILDLAVSLALGGDCLADIAILREHNAVFGQVPSDPTVSRLITLLAVDAPAALAAIDTARADARAAVWEHAGTHAPDHRSEVDHPIVIDLDATLVTAHSEKEHAAPTYKHGFGFHPLLAFVDHGPGGTGEPLAAVLRPATPGPTPLPITSRCPEKRWHSFLSRPVRGQGRRCWSVPMVPVPATTTSIICTASGCPTRSGSP